MRSELSVQVKHADILIRYARNVFLVLLPLGGLGGLCSMIVEFPVHHMFLRIGCSLEVWKLADKQYQYPSYEVYYG